MTTPEVRPNHTIYINNLNEKIKKDGKFVQPPDEAKHTEEGLQLTFSLVDFSSLQSLKSRFMPSSHNLDKFLTSWLPETSR